MALTPAEKALVFIRDLPGTNENGDIDLDWWNAYLVIWNRVVEERKAAGLLPWPHPAIPAPWRAGNAMTLLLGKAEDPEFQRIPTIEQDAWFTDMCCLDSVLALLRSPGFDSLPGREQLAALFGRWPETQR